MIKIKRIKCGFVNCYILSENGMAVLIDTGTAKYREKFLSLCERNNVELIVLTHGHIDHIQNSAYLAAELNVPIAVGEGDEELIFDHNLQPLKSDSLFGRAMEAVSNWSMENLMCPMFIPSLLLKEGDTLEEFGVNAKIISLPGHTDGSIGVDAAGRYLFAGDAMMNFVCPKPPAVYTNKEKASYSVEKIKSLGDRKIYFGHGNPIHMVKSEFKEETP